MNRIRKGCNKSAEAVWPWRGARMLLTYSHGVLRWRCAYSLSLTCKRNKPDVYVKKNADKKRSRLVHDELTNKPHSFSLFPVALSERESEETNPINGKASRLHYFTCRLYISRVAAFSRGLFNTSSTFILHSSFIHASLWVITRRQLFSTETRSIGRKLQNVVKVRFSRHPLA